MASRFTTPNRAAAPGVYTTEFWLTVFGTIGTVANLAGVWNFVPNNDVVLFQAVITALYSLSRGWTKSSGV